MGTPFVALIEPGKIGDYKVGVPAQAQPPSANKTFVDAMEVRTKVFVEEQGVAAENEYDSDDARSCHWVVYASVNKITQAEVRDHEGNIVKRQESSTRSTPIGTIRVVPFPHEPHPDPGAHYFDGKLTDEKGNPIEERRPSKISYARDRETTFHDGQEPYVKFGRLAVIEEFRGRGIAGLLVSTAISWLRANPNRFNPSVRQKGGEALHALDPVHGVDIPQWNGLTCAHAQTQMKDVWAKWGFQVDEEMGDWWEEGIHHVGMFYRIDIGEKLVSLV